MKQDPRKYEYEDPDGMDCRGLTQNQIIKKRNFKIMGEIYNIPGSEGEMNMGMSESAGPQMEKKFISATVEAVIEVLNIGWQDRRIVQALLVNSLSEKMDRRYKGEGLLQQYEAYVLELASARLKNDMDVPKEIKVNHSHATHAKLADIIDYLKDNYVPVKSEAIPKSEKGTD